jgi:PAS domain S-box-containing protein
MAKALRLLIVEDDIIDRKQLERLLARSTLEGSEVRFADHLATALQMMQESTYDVILLDLGLPDSQGVGSVTRLQALAPYVPIIVLTGLDDEKIATSAVQQGVQDYLVKGQVDSSLLVRTIRYALERKRAERELQAAEQRYRTIFENSAVAIMMVDHEERLVSWNKFTEHLLGMSRDDLLGKRVASLYPATEWEKMRKMNIREKGMQHHLETKMIRKDGAIIDVDISLSVLQESDGSVGGSIGVVQDITERKRVEEALQESERRFRQVVENAKEWIWEVDAAGYYTYASPVVERILGYKPEEVVGHKHFRDFFHPEDAEQLRAKALEIFQRKDVFSEFQTRNLTKDGKVVWLMRSGVPILNESQELLGYRGADVDTTERMRIHETLDRKQKNLEAIFDAAPVGMLLVDERKRVVRANDAVRQISGKEYHDIINLDPCGALACLQASQPVESQPADSPCKTCPLRQLVGASFESDAPVHGVEVRPARNPDGDRPQPWLSVSLEPVHIDGGKHIVIAVNDITQRKCAEEQLRETMEMKSQFISTVSHELRTPLTAMREAVIIVADGVAGKLNKDQKRFLDIARRNIERLGRLIDDVLDFQKLNAGKMEFHMQEGHIDRTIDEAYNTMLPQAQQRQLHLSVELEPNLPPVVYDNDRMIQVLTNLVSNAIKFTPEGGSVSVSARRQGEHLAILVGDTGLGIPKESLPKIFSRFYRVYRPGKEIKGTGLGLVIVDKIVAGHGGRIEIESEVNKGTTFTVLLPIAQAPPVPDMPAPADEHLEKTLASSTPS